MITNRHTLDDWGRPYDIGRSVSARWAGRSRDQVFAKAVPALFGCLTEIDRVVPREARQVELEAEDGKSLLKDWLDELILIFDSERTLFRRAETHITLLPGGKLVLKGRLWGEPADPSRHHLQGQISLLSAANLESSDDGFQASLVLETSPGPAGF